MLRQLPVGKLARALGREHDVDTLERQRDQLSDLILATAVNDAPDPL